MRGVLGWREDALLVGNRRLYSRVGIEGDAREIEMLTV